MKVRIWDYETGLLVGEIEQRGCMDVIWFAPSFHQLFAEEQPIKEQQPRGRFMLTHQYLGIPSLPYGSQEDKEPHEA